MTTALLLILVLVVGFALAAGLVPGAAWIARRYGVLDAPGPRKVHRTPTPRIGGIAVWAAFTLVVLAGYFGVPILSRLPWVETHLAGPVAMLQEAYRVETKLMAMLLGGALAFGVGLLDDMLGSRFKVGFKFAGQVLAALVLVAGGIRTDILFYEPLNIALTLVWVVGITNAFNLLDNMDGLSGGVAFVASLVLLLNAWLLGEFFISLVLFAFMGALLGFLVYNWHPELGVGLYGPCLILVSLLGMNPQAAFPIMMGSCAFLSAALGLSIGGVPAVLIAAFIVKSMTLQYLRWLVVVVVVYAAFAMLRSTLQKTTSERTEPAPA